MLKRKAVGVKQLPVVEVLFAVDGVANDGAADVFEVDADLMGPACAGFNEDEARFVIAGSDLNFGDGFSAV